MTVGLPGRVRGQDVRTTVDLFCGAGGITEGFRQAGFTCIYGNDISPWAIQTFGTNHPAATTDDRPIEQVEPRKVRKSLGIARGDLSVLVGGPPCQGFSINAPERFLTDPRNSLFRDYIRFVDEFRPRTFVFENVPGVLSLGGGQVFREIIRQFGDHGYAVSARILFAAHYGVPQERWRLILLGSRDGEPPLHPRPTHFAVRRANFTGGRALTFRLEPSDAKELLSSVSVGDAISDLPRLRLGGGSEESAYETAPNSEYSKALRNDTGVLYNHVAGRLSPQNVERMRYIKPGGSWRDIPQELLPQGMQRARRSDHTRRYGRLRLEDLAATIMTKCDPHWGPVFLPDQDRALTVREAARIQSFPDAYRFLGPRVSQYEQVGNAVPVLLAKAIATSLSSYLASV
jgi:DNA (cytosine-5)-methyltransferase 1